MIRSRKVFLKILIGIMVIFVSTVLLNSCGRDIINSGQGQDTQIIGTPPKSDPVFSESLENILNKLYENIDVDLPVLIAPEEIKIDESNVDYYLGLDSVEDFEDVVVSEAAITTIPYSTVLIRVKEQSGVESMKKEIFENVDLAKWICVRAESIYVNNCNDIIILIIANEEEAKAVYKAFNDLANGNAGDPYHKIV